MPVVYFNDVKLGDTIADKWDEAKVAAVTATAVVLKYKDGTRMAFERTECWPMAEVVQSKESRRG